MTKTQMTDTLKLLQNKLLFFYSGCLIISLVFLFLIGCGEQKVKLEESKQKVDVTIDLAYINQLREICTEAFMFDNIGPAEKSLIAQCVLNKMNILGVPPDLGSIDDGGLCDAPPPELIAACELLGGL